jgi:hypothetical protein
MIFKQFRYEPLNQASYLVGCPKAKEAFIVDPIEGLGSDFYVLEAADLGLAIVGVGLRVLRPGAGGSEWLPPLPARGGSDDLRVHGLCRR